MILSRANTVAAVIFTAIAVVLGYWCTRIRWAPRIDFDIIGFLWLVQNIPQLTLVTVTVFFGGLAVRFWIRSSVD
jgi:ABC-type proline/glycine betaine transport system permease subunit